MREKRFWASELAADAVTLAKGVAKQMDVAMTVQDRAYTSPIWYTPGRNELDQ